VIDKDSSLPLFFRYLPGNIVDVSALNATMEELKKKRINLSGKEAYAHIILDPERKGRETRDLLLIPYSAHVEKIITKFKFNL